MIFVAEVRRAWTGGKGIRTPGLLIANETLYQLSYTPEFTCENGLPTTPTQFLVVHRFHPLYTLEASMRKQKTGSFKKVGECL